MMCCVGHIDSNTGISSGPSKVKVLVGIDLPEDKHAAVQKKTPRVFVGHHNTLRQWIH